jgi:hypothetical protein
MSGRFVSAVTAFDNGGRYHGLNFVGVWVWIVSRLVLRACAGLKYYASFNFGFTDNYYLCK